MRALDSIRKDTVLLRNEIIRLTMGGWTLDLSDKVFGYVFNPYSDSIQEMEVRRLEVIDGDLYVFMTCDGDMNDYSRDEAMEYMAKESYIPGWFVIDEGFYGLQLPTLISIAEAVEMQLIRQPANELVMDKINIGDTIRIVRMDDDGGKDLQAKSYDGRTGVVESIDSLGQIHGTWGGLALIPGKDEFRKI